MFLVSISDFAKNYSDFVHYEQDYANKNDSRMELPKYNELIYTSNGTINNNAKFQTRIVRLQTLMKDINYTYPTDFELGMGEEIYVEYTLKALIQYAQD
jgi:hypothetical protein